MTIYKLYWIHRSIHTDPLSEGYIGITKDIDSRSMYHRNSKYRVGKAMRKYNDVVVDILKENMTLSEVLTLEISYRPFANLGWNIAPGGAGGVGTLKPNDNTRKKMSDARKKYCDEHGGPTRGKTYSGWSSQAKERYSTTLQAKYKDGYVNNRAGIKLGEQQKQKQRSAALNRPKNSVCKNCSRTFDIQGLATHLKFNLECKSFNAAFQTCLS